VQCLTVGAPPKGPAVFSFCWLVVKAAGPQVQSPGNRDIQLTQQFYDSLAILIVVMNRQLILSAKYVLCLMLRGVEPNADTGA
jgi:hypothetical protein